MAGKTISQADLAGAVARYCAASGKDSSIGDDGKIRIFQGSPAVTDKVLWVESGRLRGSDQDFALGFVEDFLMNAPESPKIDDLPLKQVNTQPPQQKPKSEPLVKPQNNGDEFEIVDAAREMAYIRMLLSSPAGAGKTASALLIARGLCDDWSEVCILDTEHRSGSLYANSKIGETPTGKYKTLVLDAPYSAERYMRAIAAAEKAGIKVLIIDSLTHAWTAEGGLLDLHDKKTAQSRSGNSYMAWKEVTPLHAKLIEKILGSSMHIILTARSKTEYVLEQNGKGQMAPKKVGMGIIFRDGIEYEVSIALEINQSDHVAFVSKDRTGIFAEMPYFKADIETGKKIRGWLESA